MAKHSAVIVSMVVLEIASYEYLLGKEVFPEVVKQLEDSDLPFAEREHLVQAIAAGLHRDEQSLNTLLAEIDRPEGAVEAALVGLGRFDREEVGARVLRAMPKMSSSSVAAAVAMLETRTAWRATLVQALDSGGLDGVELPVGTRERLGNGDSPTDADAKSELARLEQVLVADGPVDSYRGHAVYAAKCAACHRLHEQGGDIGPDLTAYQRDQTDDLLLAIAHPSAEIREGFSTVLIETSDGRTLSGFLKSETIDGRIVLQPIGGRPVTLSKHDIVRREEVPTSVMPPGILRGVTDAEVRNLFAYLRLNQPLPGVKKK